MDPKATCFFSPLFFRRFYLFALSDDLLDAGIPIEDDEQGEPSINSQFNNFNVPFPVDSIPPELMTMLASSFFSSKAKTEEEEDDNEELTEQQVASLEILNQQAQAMMMQFLQELVVEKKYGDLSRDKLMELVFEKVAELDAMLVTDTYENEGGGDQEVYGGEDDSEQGDGSSQDQAQTEKEEEERNLVPLSEGLQLHKLVYEGDYDALAAFFLDNPDIVMEEWEVRDLFGNTPLLLAIRRNRPDLALFLLGKGANVNVMTADQYHLLDEAVLTRWNPLIGSVYLELQRRAWNDWLGRKESVVSALRAIPDFYLELSWKFQSKGIFTPIVHSMAPKDTYKIWKKGGKLRMDSTILGFGEGGGGGSPFKIRRGNISLIFDAERGDRRSSISRSSRSSNEDEEEEEEGTQDLLLLNREEFTVSPLLRQIAKPTEQQITKVVRFHLNNSFFLSVCVFILLPMCTLHVTFVGI